MRASQEDAYSAPDIKRTRSSRDPMILSDLQAVSGRGPPGAMSRHVGSLRHSKIQIIPEVPARCEHHGLEHKVQSDHQDTVVDPERIGLG